MSHHVLSEMAAEKKRFMSSKLHGFAEYTCTVSPTIGRKKTFSYYAYLYSKY